MKSAPILLVALGLLMLYVILSDKYQCFTMFFECLTGAEFKTPEGYTRGTPQTGTPQPSSPQSYFDQIRCFFTPGGC